ncbi:MAG: hypothetical protein AB1489_41835, partial [Acidobacteriota bacterium]
MLKKVMLSFAILLLTSLPALGQVDKPLIYVCYDRREDPNDALIMLDGMTLEEIDRIPLPGVRPFILKLSSDKRIAFVSHDPRFNDTSGLSVIDLEKKQFIKTMFVGTKVFGLQLGPDGFVYVSFDSTQIALINAQTFQMEHILNLPGTPLAAIEFSPDGKRAYIPILGDQLSVIDVEAKSVIKTKDNLPVEGASQGITVSPDGRRLYLTRLGSIAVVDSESLEQLDSFPASGINYALQLTPDGKTLYSSGFFEPIVAIDTTSPNKSKTFDIEGANRFLASSPDGQLLYASNFSPFFYIIDTKTNNVLTAKVYDPEFEGSGRGIAITGNFSIGTPPTIQAISPQPGEIIQGGKPFTIRWQTTSGGFIPGRHRLEISTDGGQSFSPIMSAESLRGTTQ